MRRLMVGLVATLLFGLAVPTRAAPAPHVEMFDVEQVAQITAGTQLNFSLYGTSGGVATLQIDGARRGLALQEVQPGVYEGSYSVDAQDRIRREAQVTATLRRGNQLARAVLEEPLLLGPDQATEVVPTPLAEATPYGPTPAYGGDSMRAGSLPNASLDDGSVDNLAEPTARRGHPVPWAGTMASVDSAPAPRSDAMPIWPARVPFDGGDVRDSAARRGSPVPALSAACADCAVVESVRAVEVSGGRPGVFGAIGGGLLGAILGGQVGHGDVRGVARILGAIGGALAGREVERGVDRRTRYDVLLRLPSGAAQIRSYDTTPPLRVGDVVRLGGATLARVQRPAAPY